MWEIDMVHGTHGLLRLCLQVVCTLLDLHDTPEALAACSSTVKQDLTSVLLQQLEYIASVRTQLPSETAAACKQRFKLISSSGSVQETASLYLPPSNQAAKELLLELAQTGQGLQLLAPEFQQLWEDEEKRLVLTSVLGLKHAGAAAVVGAIADFHSSSSSGNGIDEEQLIRHLRYLADHTDILDAKLLEQFKQGVRLPDTGREYRSTSSLFFPLGQQFGDLEQELESAGMHFLNSSIAAAASGTVPGDSFSHRRIKELLLLLGTQEADVGTIVSFILQLYESPSALATLTQERHMLHVRFLCESWGDLDVELKGHVQEKLLLRIEANTSDKAASSSSSEDIDSRDASSTASLEAVASVALVFGKPSSLYIVPDEGTHEHSLLGVLELGSAKFLAKEYAAVQPNSSSSSKDLIRWLKVHLRVHELSEKQVITYILAAHEHRQALEAMFTPKQIWEHALYVAANHEWFTPGELQEDLQLQQRLLVGVAADEDASMSSDAFITASEYNIFWPEKGDGWELQQVLPPDQVYYVAPAYVSAVEQLLASADTRADGRCIKKFFTQQLDVLTMPLASAPELEATIATGAQWHTVLLLLRDCWHKYSEDEQEHLAELLSSMQVRAKPGLSHAPSFMTQDVSPRHMM
jgi:hypothetical protein